MLFENFPPHPYEKCCCVFSCSVICDLSWKLFASFSSLQNVYAIWVINEHFENIARIRFDFLYWETHKMAVHLLFEMFLCVFDWKIRVSFYSVKTKNQNPRRQEQHFFLIFLFFFPSSYRLLFQAATRYEVEKSLFIHRKMKIVCLFRKQWESNNVQQCNYFFSFVWMLLFADKLFCVGERNFS